MAKAKIQLPTVINEEAWFYKDNEELCKPHLGKPYISYSSIDSWHSFLEDFIKQKFGHIEVPDNIYAIFGSYIGEAVEHGKFAEENPHKFEGQEHLKGFLDDRPANAEYERMILIDMGEYVIIGFIDVFFLDADEKANVIDIKTGGKNKEKKYESDEYIQVPLYAKAIQDEGIEIANTGVYFIRREGSHINPPLKISQDQFFMELEYNDERVEYALKRADETVREISDCYKTFLKVFGNVS